MSQRKRFRPLHAESLESRLALATVTVNSIADDTNNDAVLTLREAIALVNYQGNANATFSRGLTTGEAAQVDKTIPFGTDDTIVFDAALDYQSITLVNSRLSVMRSVSIEGPGPDKLTIDGGTGQQHFYIDGRTNGNIDVNISDLTLLAGIADGLGGFITGGVDNSVRGGSIFNDTATLVIDHVALISNQANLEGGAVYNSLGTVEIKNSSLTENQAVDGGSAVTNGGGSVTLTQSTVASNYVSSATAVAGAIQNLDNGTLVINQSTIAENTINNTTGFSAIYATGTGTTNTITNSVVIANVRPFSSDLKEVGFALGAVVNSNYNYYDRSYAIHGFVNGLKDILGNSELLFTALEPRSLNNSALEVYLPTDYSPLLDAGDNNLAPAGLDQRGGLRIIDGPDADIKATVDIGAVEGSFAIGPFVVDLDIDEDDGDFSAGDLSLREALQLADIDPAADVITFAPGITSIPLNLGTLTLNDTAKTTINGNGVRVYRESGVFGIFSIHSNAKAELNGLSIEDGSLPSNEVGGGIYNAGTLTVNNSTISGNSAGSGGGIFNFDTLTLVNSTLSGNSARNNGGGIYNLGTLTVLNSTVTNNQADSDTNAVGDGGGIWTFNNVIAQTTLQNTIVAGNYRGEGGIPSDLGARNVESISSYNLIGSASSAGGLTDNTKGNRVGVDVSTVLDPTLANNGGPTRTHALLFGSPAVNAGSNANAVGLTTDQRGFSRILKNTVDIGAVESDLPGNPFIVDLATDEDDTDYSAGDLSLREAIRLSNTSPSADSITFAPGITLIPLTLGTLTLTDTAKTTIIGNGVTVSLSSRGAFFSLFEVDPNAVAEFDDLTIRKGFIFDSFGPYPGGGAIYNQGTLTVKNTTFSENGSVTSGGGIYNDGSLTVLDSTFLDNVSLESGGAIYNFGLMTMSNSTISRSFSLSSGGGIFNEGTLTVTNSTISENVAQTAGGGITNYGTLSLTNTTISGNVADDFGGGIYSQGIVTVINSTLTNNRADYNEDSLGDGGGIWTDDAVTNRTTLHNTIVAGNFIGKGTTSGDLSGKNLEPASSNNLIGDATSAGGLSQNTNGNIVGVPVATVLYPKLTDNGGPTLTHALIQNSPAINAGSNANVPSGTTTDQRGSGFARIFNSTVDIGAVEAQDFTPPTVVITPPIAGASPLVFTFQFNEPIVGFTASDLVITNGTPAEPVAGASNTFTVTVTPTNIRSLVTVLLPAGAVSDLAGNVSTEDSNLATGNYSTSDINRDGVVDLVDVLNMVFYFNLFSSANQLPYDVSQLPPDSPLIDATGDGNFDLADLLHVVFTFGDNLLNPEGEGGGIAPATNNTPAVTSSTPATADAITASDAVFADESLTWLWYEGLPQKRRRGA